MAGITLLQKLQKLYGARAVTDRLGVTTNVQTLAQGQNNPFALSFSKKYLKKNPDGVEEASKVIMENMQFAFGNKNAQQMKNFEYNVNTLFDMKFPPAKAEAQILDLSTKKQVTGKGIDSLKDKMGLPEGVSPDSPMGKILTSQNKLKRMSQELSDLGAKTYSAPEEGMRRAVMRQILLRDRRINLPENIRDSLDNFKDLQRGGDQSMDPLTLFTKYYKRDNAKLDNLDEISRESKDAIDAADNFLVKDDTIELLDDDIGTKLKDYDGDPDAMAIGGRVGYGKGDLVTKGIPALKKLIKDKFGKKSITTADKIKQPQSALDRKMFEDFNARTKSSYKPGDAITSENFESTGFAPDLRELKKARELAPKMTERLKLKARYPGITDDLLDSILIDDNPQRKAEVLATLDEIFTMMNKGKGPDEILSMFKNINRTKQADGGIAGQLHLNRTGYDMGGAAATDLAITQSLKDFKRYQKAGGKLSYKDFIASGNEGVSRFFNEGGRVGLEKGGPPNPGRRNFMKLMAGLASLPIVGKLFKGAKVASKVVPLKNTTTAMPAWFPDLVDKFVAKGVRNKIDEDMIEYSVKELPDVKMVERTDGMISVEGKNAYNEDYFIQYEPPGYTVVDEKTGKAVKTPGEFVATDTEYRMVSPEDYDIDGVTVNDVDELLGGSSNQLEGFAKGTGKTKNTIGQQRIDEADARGARSKEEYGRTDRADVYDPYEGMDPTDFGDPEDFATGGRVGMLAGGSVLKTIIKNLAKERGVKPSYLLEMINVKSLPKQIRDKMSPKEIKGFLEKRIEQTENFRDMMESRVKFNQSIQQGKKTGMPDIFDFMDESFTKGSPVPRDVSEADVLQMEQMIKNMKTKGRKLNAKGGLAGQLL